jgi:hypothetical protein
MKKYICMVLVLSLLFLSGCGYNGSFSSEASDVCISLCASHGMSYDAQDTQVWTNTIECSCNAAPVLRSHAKQGGLQNE